MRCTDCGVSTLARGFRGLVPFCDFSLLVRFRSMLVFLRQQIINVAVRIIAESFGDRATDLAGFLNYLRIFDHTILLSAGSG